MVYDAPVAPGLFVSKVLNVAKLVRLLSFFPLERLCMGFKCMGNLSLSEKLHKASNPVPFMMVLELPVFIIEVSNAFM